MDLFLLFYGIVYLEYFNFVGILIT
jgi:hypothetical protein